MPQYRYRDKLGNHVAVHDGSVEELARLYDYYTRGWPWEIGSKRYRLLTLHVPPASQVMAAVEVTLEFLPYPDR